MRQNIRVCACAVLINTKPQPARNGGDARCAPGQNGSRRVRKPSRRLRDPADYVLAVDGRFTVAELHRTGRDPYQPDLRGAKIRCQVSG